MASKPIFSIYVYFPPVPFKPFLRCSSRAHTQHVYPANLQGPQTQGSIHVFTTRLTPKHWWYGSVRAKWQREYNFFSVWPQMYWNSCKSHIVAGFVVVVCLLIFSWGWSWSLRCRSWGSSKWCWWGRKEACLGRNQGGIYTLARSSRKA
jgi:hypothetical protein